MGKKMHYVYLLRSEKQPDQTYIGFTADLKARLKRHNAGRCTHTRKYIPWNLITYLGFDERERALRFEKYLKTHSGKAFSSKRLF